MRKEVMPVGRVHVYVIAEVGENFTMQSPPMRVTVTSVVLLTFCVHNPDVSPLAVTVSA